MAAELGIQERRIGAVTILELSGWLVAYEGEHAFRAHATALTGAGHMNLLLDMSRLTSMDSAGVGVLVSMLLHVTRRGGKLKLLKPTERVVRVLEITRLLDTFEIFDGEEAAVASFPAAPEGGTPQVAGGR